MAAPKAPALPAILLANDLLSGDVVFRTNEGWSRDPRDARVVDSVAGAEALEAEGKASMAANTVIDAYLVDVDVNEAGVPVPRHFRERYKILGPSNRPDLGKQAEYTHLSSARRA
jgi:sulfite reductase (NADPH) hemoprotein beta-component